LTFGLNFLASYTWSKSLDIQSEGQSGSIQTIYDLRRDWGPSDYNRTHLFTFSGIYQVPVGKGKAYLSNPSGFARTVLGNWNMGWVVTLNSGQPFRILAGGDIADVGGEVNVLKLSATRMPDSLRTAFNGLTLPRSRCQLHSRSITLDETI
jgi:hypothetical protein